MKTAFFITGLLVMAALMGCQTPPQKTVRDPLINEALMKASIPASRGALVTVVSHTTRRILSQPIYHGVIGSRQLAELLSHDWVGRPISDFEQQARSFFSGPVQEFGYPEAGKHILVFSN